MELSAMLKSELFWTAAGAIATGVGSVAILLAVSQLRFEAWLKAQDIWTAQDFIAARGRVFARLDAMSAEWARDEEAQALDVCRRMDEFAGLVPYLPKRTALRIWGVPFAKAWAVLEPVIQRERTKCDWPDKWHAFERLGRAAIKRHPEVGTNKRSPSSSERGA
jgi:hypothetical protein